jgi:hypothetical protein
LVLAVLVQMTVRHEVLQEAIAFLIQSLQMAVEVVVVGMV